MATNTRLLSFLQLCIEADPDFYDDLNWPVQYEFPNGRDFWRPNPVYTGVTVPDEQVTQAYFIFF